MTSLTKKHLLFAIALIGSTILLTFRMTLGSNFSDEAYYAAFVDGWLKTNLAQNTNLMLHQTAALLVYPATVAFKYFNGNTNGLIFFLRIVYLAIAVLASLCIWRAVLLYRGHLAAALSALFGLWFIPFGLPAPSYNTIGMWSVAAALALFTIPFTDSPKTLPIRLPASLWLSAIWWTVGTIAYPTIVVPATALITLAPFFLRTADERRLIAYYGCAYAGILAISLITLIALLGLQHTWETIRFTNSVNDVSTGLPRKVLMASKLLAAHPHFIILGAISAFVALIGFLYKAKSCARIAADSFVVLIIIGAATMGTATLSIRSHDLVVLLAIAGSGIAFRQLHKRESSSHSRSFGLVYAIALLAGTTVAMTAYNGLYNFPIGCFMAACLTIAMLSPSGFHASSSMKESFFCRTAINTVRYSSPLIACGMMSMLAFANYYGEPGYSYTKSMPISEGAFAGLRTNPERASYAQSLMQAIESQNQCGSRLAVWRGESGAYIMTSMRPVAVTSWNPPANAGNFAFDAINRFYAQDNNQPDVIVIDNRNASWLPQVPPFLEKMLSQYTLAERLISGSYDTSIFRRAACASRSSAP